jgi:hypothetical protein
MQWSKLKARLKDRICPELQARVDFHLTSYRGSHDGADKVWICVDGEQIFSCKHYPYQRAEADAYWAGLRGREVKAVLGEIEIHSPADFGEAMRNYLDLSIGKALESHDPLIKAFAIIDRRLGKRALARLEISDSEHSLVKAFYALRLGSAHIQQALGADSP